MGNPLGETQLTITNGNRVVYEWQRDNTAAIGVYVDGTLTAPFSATYELTGPADTTVASGAATIGGDSLPKFTLTAAMLPETVTLGPGYTEVWGIELNDGDPVEHFRRLVAVGRYRLYPPILVSDLTDGEYPDLTTSLGPAGEATLRNLMSGTWAYCLRYLEKKGTWEDVVVDSADAFDWYRHETLARAFKAMVQMQDTERWHRLWTFHQDRAEGLRQGLTFTPDRDRDGKPDHHGKEAVSTTVHVNTPPRRRSRRSRKW